MAARNLPPVKGLVALDAFARCGTIRAAALELGVLPSTVSRQLSELEQALGVRITIQDGRALRLTGQGRAFAEQIAESLLLAEGAYQSFRESLLNPGPTKTTITVLVSGALAIHWFPQPLARWRSLHPNIQVRLRTGVRLPAWEDLDFDIALRLTPSNKKGIVNEFIAHDEATLTISRESLLKRSRPVRVWELFETHPLLVCQNNDEGTGKWLAENGLRELQQQRHRRVPIIIDAMNSLLNGTGSMVCSRLLFEDLIGDGTLVEPWPERRTRMQGWWLCGKEDSLKFSCVEQFSAFLAREISRTLG